MQVTETKYLGCVKEVTRMGRIRNNNIAEELKIESIQQTLGENKLKWFGHIETINDGTPNKCVEKRRK